MGEYPSPAEEPECRPACQTEKFPPIPRYWFAAAALVAVGAAGLLLYWGSWRNEPSLPDEAADLADGRRAAPEKPPATSPAQLLGLSPELPKTVEALNQEAFHTCAHLMRDLPDRPEAYAVAAFIFNRHGRTSEATECWNKALEVNPYFAPSYCGLGIVAADKGEYEEAVKKLRRAIELDPWLGRAHSLLVDVLLRQGQAEKALTAARDYVRRFPESGDSHYWLGQTCMDLGEYDEARKSHEAAVRFDPAYTAAYSSLATACARLGEREQAREYREKFAVLKEKDLQEDRGRSREYRDLPTQQQLAASYHLAAGNVHVAFGDPKKAEAHWLRGAAVAPQRTGCREALVAFYERQGSLFAAMQQLNALIALEPRNAVYWTRSGRVQARLRQLAAAEASFRKAVELAPEAAEGYSALVELHLQFRRPIPDAAALAEKAAALAPSARAYLALSAARDKSGDRQGAISAVEKALELEPTNPLLQEVYENLRESDQ